MLILDQPILSKEDAIVVAFEALKRSHAKAVEIGYRSPLPEVIWEIRFSKAGGWANLGENRIRLNESYLYSKDARQFVEETIIHEFAHLVAYQLSDDSGHGRKWKQIAIKLGHNGERCHNYKCSLLHRRFIWVCRCPDGIPLSVAYSKHCKLRLEGKKCRKCQVQLRYLSNKEYISNGSNKWYEIANKTKEHDK